ncbi:MAG: thiamine pyrophosphate-binding protein [Betaproteobacteria bacterium]|nr:MAG: thiamine pyrophosphate-binding protein [Betaproteobacteria bacterium]
MTDNTNAASGIKHETPAPSPASDAIFGSDVIAGTLRALNIEYIALNPGASYRGLHDSLVNYLGNKAPQMVLCLHDENAASIAQGYWKAANKLMAVGLHSNVGLMHASMPIFNAWCDRTPMLILGATGPWDAAKRRPWIDWIHTCSDQAALVRNFTKWDNQPGSTAAAVEALLRGAQIAETPPRAPVYVNLDVSIQEEKLETPPVIPDVARFAPPPPVQPGIAEIEAAAKLLSAAKHPVMLAGRGSRSLDAWNARVALAEKLDMRVLTQIKLAAAFPTDHRLHAAPPANRLVPAARKTLAAADVILSLDWLDLAGALKQTFGDKPVTAKIIQVSCDTQLHRGWSMDYQALPPVDVYMNCEPDAAVPLLTAAVTSRPQLIQAAPKPLAGKSAEPLALSGLAYALNAAVGKQDVSYTHLPLGWSGAYTHFRHPLDFLGFDGGGGVGAGPGLTIGAALALKGSGRIPIGLMGDGNFLMGNTAVWTAVHYQIPCLMIICNNRSFFNDERHQGHVAEHRGRPSENAWIGQKIIDPDIDIAAMARAQGAEGIGPVTQMADMQPAIARGIAIVKAGGVCVIDARVLPGYDGE